MAYKTILVLCDASDAAAARLAFADRLACAYGAHLIALYVAPVFMAAATLSVSLGIASHYRRHEEMARPGIENTRALFGRIVKESGLTSEWYASIWSPVEDAVELARYADLVVMGQVKADRSADHLPSALLESLIVWSGRPVVVVPLAPAALTTLRKAVLCWDGTREVALTASQALPLLKAAQEVDVLRVDLGRQSAGSESSGRADPTVWLGRHGVVAKRSCRLSLSNDVGEEIVCYASDVEADFIVMGGYGHSRLRQAVLGGASRTVLARMSVPVVMAH